MESTFAPTPSRREARRQVRREAILDVAAQSFLENGYAGTTMSAIAMLLGGSKATLWNYFPSKEQLFAAVLDRETEEFQQQLSLILKSDAPAERALTGFCRQFLNKVTDSEAVALYRLVVGEASRFPEMGRIFYERAAGRTRLILANYLAHAMDRGHLRQADPEAAAIELTGLCMSGCHMLLLLGAIEQATPRMIESDARRTVDTFLRAYAPPA